MRVLKSAMLIFFTVFHEAPFHSRNTTFKFSILHSKFSIMSILYLRWASAILAVFNLSLSSSLVIQHNHAPTNETFIQDVVNCQSSVLSPMVEFVATNYIAHAFTIWFSP